MPPLRKSTFKSAVLLALLAASVPAGFLLRAQRLVDVSGSKFAEYYPVPNDTKIKSMLEAAKAVQQPDGRTFLITKAKLQTYRLTGEGEQVVEAPECLYNADSHAISSSGPLLMRTADGQFYLEGEGFLWQPTNSVLFVSNKVHTVVHAKLVNGQASASTNAGPVEEEAVDIFADRFQYTVDTGVGVYRDNVRVSGTNLNLTGGTLTVDIPKAEGKLKSLVATKEVVVDYVMDRIKTQTRGQRVSYDVDKDVMHVQGQPTWRADQREGRGDELLLDRKNGIFESAGNAWLKMPSQGQGGGGFLPQMKGKTEAPAPGTNQWVEIFSDRYVIRTNSAVFSEDVRVIDSREGKTQGKMSCALLTATFAGTNELQKLIADKNVIIESETNRFTAGRAEYTGTNGIMELTENPTWKAGLRDGRGQLILVNVASNEMSVFTNAIMRLPAQELGKSALSGSPGVKKSVSRAGPMELAVISSDEYVVGPEMAQFRRNVRIEHPQMTWVSDLITATMPGSGDKIPRIVAERSVAFDMVDELGRKVHGTGDQAVYTYTVSTSSTNESMELTGNPAVVTASTNIVGQNNIILLNLTTHTVTAPGRYNIKGTVPRRAGAQAVVLPTEALTR